MTQKKQNNKDHPNADHTPEKQSVAERYLDLWQDNIRLWATDPDAIEKWLTDVARKQTKP